MIGQECRERLWHDRREVVKAEQEKIQEKKESGHCDDEDNAA
jgi:hypothetical protein